MTERDLTDWRGIGTGFVILICVAGGLAMGILAPASWDPWLAKELGAVVLAALYGIWWLTRPLLRRGADWWAGGDRSRHEWLKNFAVVVLCAISVAMSVAAVPLALRYAW